MLKNLLAHPLTRGLDIDDPRCTELRRSLIRNKSFLRQIYQEWYGAIAALLPLEKDPVLEFLFDFRFNIINQRKFTHYHFINNKLNNYRNYYNKTFRQNNSRKLHRQLNQLYTLLIMINVRPNLNLG